MRREDPRRVGECEELIAHRSVQPLGQIVGGPADRDQEIGSTDITDEEGVAGEHSPRLRIVGMLPHHDGDRLRGVPRRRAHLEEHLTEREPPPVRHRIDREVGLRLLAVGDRRPRGRGQLEVAREEVGVEVGLEHALDREPERLGVGEVLGDVALRIDDDRSPCGLVTDQVREEGEATEFVLAEDHRGLPVMRA